MRDSDQEYPLHQPGQVGHHSPFDDDTEDELDGKGRLQGSIQGPLHQRETADAPHLPRHRFRNTLIIGIIAGILAALQGSIVTLANASLYRTASGPANQVTLNVASAVVGLLCLTIFISLIIYFIAGFITGKVAVERRMGFLAGFVGAAVAYVLAYVVQQIPGYPGAHATGFSGGLVGIAGGLTASLILLAISAAIAGLVSLLGAWLATRKHPYYYVQ